MKTLPRLTWEEGFILNQLYTDYTKVPGKMKHLIDPTKAKNEKIFKLYLAQKEFDIYFATSLRSKEDFEKSEMICQALEKLDSNLKIIMPLSFFVPKGSTLRKGDLERLFLQRSKMTFLYDSGKDTWGRDTEAAEMLLVYRKPVVILVSDKSDGTHASRYRIFKEIHPKNVIGSFNDARGMHVVKSLEDATRCVRNILNNSVKARREVKDGGLNEYCLNCGSLLRRSKIDWIQENFQEDKNADL